MPDIYRYLLAACCLALQLSQPLASFAGTYTWTDGNGVVHFSDSPSIATEGSSEQVEIRELDVNPKWTAAQKKGERLYEDEMISVALVREESHFIRFNVAFDLPEELLDALNKELVYITVMAADYNLPQGVYSYLSNSVYHPKATRGSIELRVGTTDRSPLPLTSNSLAVLIMVNDKQGGKGKTLLYEKVAHRKTWQ